MESIYPTGPMIDAHCHVASTDFISPKFIDGVVENTYTALISQGIRATRPKVLEMFLAKLNDPHCEELAAEMREAGVDKVILLLPDFTYSLKDSALTIEEMFDRHRAIIERWPDLFVVFAGVDPRWGKDASRLFEKGITQYGFRGLKLYPPCGYSPSDTMLYPFYEICAKYNLPVVTHVGATSPALEFEPARPIHVDKAAKDFPSVNFILAHGSTAYVDECAMLCTYRPNIFVDISGFASRPIRHLERIFSCGINHKILFGSDWPVFRLQGNQKSYIDQLLALDGPLQTLRPTEVNRVFGQTIERLLQAHIEPSESFSAAT